MKILLLSNAHILRIRRQYALKGTLAGLPVKRRTYRTVTSASAPPRIANAMASVLCL